MFEAKSIAAFILGVAAGAAVILAVMLDWKSALKSKSVAMMHANPLYRIDQHLFAVRRGEGEFGEAKCVAAAGCNQQTISKDVPVTCKL